MRQRTDRVLILEPLTHAPGQMRGAGRQMSASGEIWVGESASDVRIPRPSKLVVVRGRRRYFG